MGHTTADGRLRELLATVVDADEGRLRAEDGRGRPARIGTARSEIE